MAQFLRVGVALAILLGASTSTGFPCTTAVISGRVTADGRPLLWKNRDFPQVHNEVVYFHAEDGNGYSFVGVVNAGGSRSVYMGVNTAGFCIENSLSNDAPGRAEEGPGNGQFMKLALSRCATVDDFTALLTETNVTGRKTRANFGVIDAHGGAAIFEAGARSFVKFDANDPETAPQGFVVRANFSATGRGIDLTDEELKLEGVYSAERYRRGCELCRQGLANRTLDVRFFLRNVTRDLADAEGRPLPGSVNGDPTAPLPAAIDIDRTISRRTTVSAAVFAGVKPGEDPALTTMWVLLGQPAFSIAVPCWPGMGEVAEDLDGPEVSRLCSLSLKLRNDRFDAGKLRTTDLLQLWRRTFAMEDTILTHTQTQLKTWRKHPPTNEQLAKWHRERCEQAADCLADLGATKFESQETKEVQSSIDE